MEKFYFITVIGNCFRSCVLIVIISNVCLEYVRNVLMRLLFTKNSMMKHKLFKKMDPEKLDFIGPESKMTQRVTKYIKKSFNVKHRILITE